MTSHREGHSQEHCKGGSEGQGEGCRLAQDKDHSKDSMSELVSVRRLDQGKFQVYFMNRVSVRVRTSGGTRVLGSGSW